MTQVDSQVLLFRQLQNKRCTVVATSRGIEYLFRVVCHQQKRFRAARQFFRRDDPQNRAFHRMRAFDIGLVNFLDDLFGKVRSQPLVLVGIVKIDRRIVDCLRHISKVDVQHGITSQM